MKPENPIQAYDVGNLSLSRDGIEANLSYLQEHIEQKNAEVRAALAEIPKVEMFALFADAHVRQNRFSSVPVLRSILENTPVETVLYAGDTVSAYGDDKMLREDVVYFNQMFAFANLYPARGNHDMYAKPFEEAHVGYVLSSQEVYAYIFQDIQHKVHGSEGKTYYWFDHEDTKVRYIVLDTNEICIAGYHENGVWDQMGCSYTAEQLQWFAEVLLHTPADYTIIVMGHLPVVKELAWSGAPYMIFGDIIEAYNTRAQKALEGYDVSLEVDFRQAVSRVVLYLCGHGHRDDLYTSPSGCAYYEIHTDSMCDNGGSIYPKKEGTITETAVDVILYDRDSGKIRNIRYGAGANGILREADGQAAEG